MARMSRYAHVVKRFRDAVLGSPGRLPPETRRAVFEGGAAGAETEAYLDKVRRHAHRITDEDIAALRAAGWDDERLYELTVAAAAGQGLRRLDLGLAALRASRRGLRLPRVERGEGRSRLIFAIIRLVSGYRAPDVLRTIFFRRQLFGTPFSQLVQATLRGPSGWSVGEREMFAAFVSERNKCRF